MSFAAWSIALSVTDLRSRRLSNRMLIAATASTLPLLAASGFAMLLAGESPQWIAGERIPARPLLDLLGVASAFGIGFALLWKWFPVGLGGGDVKLAPLAGAAIGFAGGWWAALFGLVIAFGAAAASGLAIRNRRHPHRRTVPFAPCLLSGAWMAILVL